MMDIHGTYEEMLVLTYDDDPKVRCRAVQQLCPCHVKMNRPVVWDRLIEMATDHDPKVRGHVLHVLADGSPRERGEQVIAAIERMQHDPDLKLRRRARQLLAQYRRTGNINVL